MRRAGAPSPGPASTGSRRKAGSGRARSMRFSTPGPVPSGFAWRYDDDEGAVEIVRRRSVVFRIHALAGKQRYVAAASDRRRGLRRRRWRRRRRRAHQPIDHCRDRVRPLAGDRGAGPGAGRAGHAYRGGAVQRVPAGHGHARRYRPGARLLGLPQPARCCARSRSRSTSTR